MQQDKNKIETILFTIGRFVGLEELSKMCGIASLGYLKDVLRELADDYIKRDCSLEITENGNRWKLNIKKEYLHLTESLLEDPEFDGATQETLAVIAYKNPALQSEIIKIRGNGAYDHIKILKDMELILTEPFGRSKIIKLTNKFYDYFDIIENHLKSKLQIKNDFNGSEVNIEPKPKAEVDNEENQD